MRSVALVAMVVLVGAGGARGQVSVEEARRRLAERQSRRAAESRPATNPAARAGSTTQASGDVDVEHMAHEAWGQVLAKRYEEGVRLFSEVIAKQPASGSAWQGRAVCEYELSKYKAAEEDGDRAVQFSKANPALARQAVLVAACTYVEANVPLRAVRIAMDALKAEEKQNILDEEMQNLLGTAVWRCKPESRGLPLVREAGTYYMAYDAKLAHEREGRRPKYVGFDVTDLNRKSGAVRRWGTQWLAADDAEARWATYANAVGARDAAAGEVAKAVRMRVYAEKVYAQMHDMKEPRALLDMQASSENLQQAIKYEAGTRENLKTVEKYLSTVESPPFPVKPEPAWAEPVASAPATQPSTRSAADH